MKVYIGPYKNWFGPHQLAEKLCFWAKKDIVDEYGMRDYPEYVFKLGEFLAYGKWRGIDDIPSDTKNLFIEKEQPTWLYLFLERIAAKRDRKIKIRVDKYDTWSMDCTLAKIVHPMLLQLKTTKHGYPINIDAEDVPEKLQCTNWEEEDAWYYGQLSLFDMEVCNPEFCSVAEDRWNWVLDEMIFAFSNLANDDYYCIEKQDRNRIENGFRLFGKYYTTLWD